MHLLLYVLQYTSVSLNTGIYFIENAKNTDACLYINTSQPYS